MKATYSIAPDDATTLAAACVLPQDERRHVLSERLSGRSRDEVVSLLCEFIGLARSVEENAVESTQLILAMHGGYHPDTSNWPNHPSLLGAIEGTRIARKVTKGMCRSCAFRLGTIPNQCLPTVQDTTYARENSANFMCHDVLDAEGEPVALCAGYAAHRAEVEAAEVSR